MKYLRTKKELSDFIPLTGLKRTANKTSTAIQFREIKVTNKEITPTQQWIDDTIDTGYFLGVLTYNILPFGVLVYGIEQLIIS